MGLLEVKLASVPSPIHKRLGLLLRDFLSISPRSASRKYSITFRYSYPMLAPVAVSGQVLLQVNYDFLHLPVSPVFRVVVCPVTSTQSKSLVVQLFSLL